MFGFGGTLDPECRRHAPGVTFPRAADGTLDLIAVTRCARRLKRLRPDETEVSVLAAPSIPYRELVSVLDAVRSDESGELFTELMIGPIAPSSVASPAPATSKGGRPGGP